MGYTHKPPFAEQNPTLTKRLQQEFSALCLIHIRYLDKGGHIMILIKNGKVHTMAGPVLENGCVLIKEDRKSVV